MENIDLAPGLVRLLFLLFVVIQVCRLFYNIWLHPLAKVPGPLGARLSSLYIFPAVLRLDKAQTLARLHEKYGAVVRVASNEVSVSDWTRYREIYSSETSHKAEGFYASGSFLGHETLFSMRGKAQHHARRKMQSQPYSQQSVLAHEAHISSKADVLLRRMRHEAGKSATGKTVDVFNLCALFSLEVILKIGFDRDCEESLHSMSQHVLDAMDDSALLLPGAMPFLKPLRTAGMGRHLPGPFGKPFRQFELWIDITTSMLEELRQQENALDKTQRFLATPLLANPDDFLGRVMTDGEIVEEAMGIMFAGSRTTSTTLTYLIYALASAQDIQTRLREELQAVGDNLSEIKDLPLLNAVVKETFRLYPTVISTLPRVLDKPLSMGDHVLPKGTGIGMQNYVHHRDPKVFPQPDAFVPDRWRDDNSDMNSALTPFSLGPRNCIGQNIARAELYLAASKIFRTMKVKLADTMNVSDMAMEDVFISMPKGRKLVIEVETVL